jgi:curved DNA-binding protein
MSAKRQNEIVDPHLLNGRDSEARRAALSELGLAPGSSDEIIRKAFRTRLKESHPDLTGGSDVALRRLILARDLLMNDNRNGASNARWLKDLAESGVDGDGAQLLNITLEQAIYGGEAVQDVHALEISQAHEEVTSLSQMKTLRIALPAGLRDGDRLRLTTEGAPRPEQLFRIHIVTENGTRIVGDDVHVVAKIDGRLLFNGGPAVVDTPHGPREVHIPRGDSQLTLKGLGLPATGKRGCGDLHVRLEASTVSSRAWSEAMVDFRRKWAS